MLVLVKADSDRASLVAGEKDGGVLTWHSAIGSPQGYYSTEFFVKMEFSDGGILAPFDLGVKAASNCGEYYGVRSRHINRQAKKSKDSDNGLRRSEPGVHYPYSSARAGGAKELRCIEWRDREFLWGFHGIIFGGHLH